MKGKFESYSIHSYFESIINPICVYHYYYRLYGIVDFSRWQYYVRDPEIIRKIGIKDFDYFEDHRGFIDETIDKLWGNSLFLMKGQKWRQMRATLSPAFTGSKMRQMFELVSECSVDVINYLTQQNESCAESLNFEMKDLFSRYVQHMSAILSQTHIHSNNKYLSVRTWLTIHYTYT